jgi:drug/metabolite transporter (DMT)-like permease
MEQPVAATRMSAQTWGLLALLGMIWGGSFFFARVAVAHVPPATLVLLRVGIAALALHIYVAGRFGIYATLRERWREFLLLGLINNAVPHMLIFLGQTQIGAGLASILNATTPIFTVLIANRMTVDEKLSSEKIAGCLIGLVGTAVLIGPRALAPFTGAGGPPLWAVLLPVLAAVSYGFAATYGKRFRGRPAHGLDAADAARLPCARFALAASPAPAVGHPRRAGAGARLDGLWLHPVLPDHGGGRRDQYLARHLARAAQRDSRRHAVPRRNPDAARHPRHGAGARGPRRARRARPRPFAHRLKRSGTKRLSGRFMAIRRIADPTYAIMVNAQCRHSSFGRDCEFFVARTIKEEIQQVRAVNNHRAEPGCCNAATKYLSNPLFSVVISDRKRKEVSHGTHTFLECSDDQCSVPLHRNDDFHLRRSKRSRKVRDKNKKPCRNPLKKRMAPETAPCVFI